jgi:thioredoxin-like negative regulator of GroEL
MESLRADQFQDGRLTRPGRVTVLFTDPGCPFCHRFLPQFEALDGKVDGSLAYAELPDYENPLWEEFHIAAVPTVIGFEDGQQRWRYDGPLGVGLGEAEARAIARRLSGRPARDPA